MNETTSFEIQDKVRKAAEPNFNYDFDFGNILSRGLDLSKEDIGAWAVFNLVYFLMSLLLTITVIGIVALPALNFGYIYTVRKVMKGGKVETGDIFKGFDHFGKLLSIGLLAFGALYSLMMLLYIPLYIILIVGQAMLFFAPHFGVYGNMGAVEALKASFSFAKKKWLWWVLAIFVCGLLGSVGMIACYIGVIFTIHFSYVTLSSAFLDIVDKNDGIEEKIEQTFV